MLAVLRAACWNTDGLCQGDDLTDEPELAKTLSISFVVLPVTGYYVSPAGYRRTARCGGGLN